MSHLEDVLRDTLSSQAEQTPVRPTPLARVARSARAARRRRAAGLTLAATAAVVAVAVPAVLVAGGERSAPDVPVATDPTTPPSETPATDGAPLTGYVVDGVYHAPDGSPVTLPSEQPQDVVPVGDRLLVASDPDLDGPLLYLTTVGADGTAEQPEGEVCSTGYPNAGQGGAVAWITAGCDDRASDPVLHVWADGTETTAALPARAGEYGWRIFGVGVDGTVALWSAADAEAIVLDRDGTERSRVELPSPDGYDAAHDRFLTTFLTVRTEAGMVTSDGEVLWREDGLLGGRISPDGTRVLAWTQGGSRAEVLDADTGETLARVDLPADTGRLVWEDEEHLLGVDLTVSEQRLVRVDATTGEVTPVPGIDPLPVGSTVAWTDTLF
ncbi:MAG: hypothetical protein CMH83_21070 [Nocardioides sp.]|nr:hypothetical protein [Nocardioides sp.]